jgi:hypothetical protein
MSDNVVIAIVTGAFSIIGVAIGGFISVKLAKIEKKVDGRLSELLEITKTSSKAEGNLVGRKESKSENK